MPKIELPHPFLEKMSLLLGTEYEAFLLSYEKPRLNGLRVNTLKIAPEDFLDLKLFHLEPILWAADGFYYDYKDFPGQHPYHAAGLYYLQEPSAMAVVHYLDPQPGEWILDLAAAPGGKTTHIASCMKNTGLLWANEINPKRANILAGNLERWGVYNTIVSNESPDRLAKNLSHKFDRILLDAPCSGEGMFRKDPDTLKEWSPEHVTACAKRQSLILDSAAQMLKPGGRLVYSTCTFSQEENEEVILSFLSRNKDFKPIKLPDPSSGFKHSSLLPEAVRLYPHHLQGEGHFIAVLQRSQENQVNAQPSALEDRKPVSYRRKNTVSRKEKNTPKAQIEELSNFEQTTLTASLNEIFSAHNLSSQPSYNHYIMFGNHYYWTPILDFSFAGLSIIRPGLYLGEKKPGRFQPGHALALALKPNDVRSYLSLPSSDPRLVQYLAGESWSEPGPDGWVLVGINKFPLGWAKRANGQLKNFYPKSWRQR